MRPKELFLPSTVKAAFPISKRPSSVYITPKHLDMSSDEGSPVLIRKKAKDVDKAIADKPHEKQADSSTKNEKKDSLVTKPLTAEEVSRQVFDFVNNDSKAKGLSMTRA